MSEDRLVFAASNLRKQRDALIDTLTRQRDEARAVNDALAGTLRRTRSALSVAIAANSGGLIEPAEHKVIIEIDAALALAEKGP